MININDDKYKELKFATDTDILECISDYNIFKYYYPEFQPNVSVKSPLRKDDNPSFSIFWSSRYNRLFFKDFATGMRGDVFVFLSKYLNLEYPNVMSRIVFDFNLTDKFATIYNKKFRKSKPVIYSDDYIDTIKKDTVNIQVKLRGWNKSDIEFWGTYGVSESTLKKYRVIPISFIFLNDAIIKADKLSYAYVEYKDELLRYKIYQPKSDKMKWVNNLVEGTLSGWTQMPETGDYLIITSSLKDAMCVHDIGFKNVLAPQTENYIFKPHIVEILKSRFKNIYIFYDNDDPGINASKKMAVKYGFKEIFTGINSLKDASDYYKEKGEALLYWLIKSQLV